MVIGAEVTQTIDFDDYREVDGTKVAFAVTTTGQHGTFSSKTRRIQYNVPVDPAIFEYQAGGGSNAGASVAEKRSEPVTTGAVPAVVAENDDRLAEKVRVDTFELVWSTVNDSYFDATFGGV